MALDTREARLLRRRALRYVHRYVPTKRRMDSAGLQWDGETLSLNGRWANYGLELRWTMTLVHDVNHWRVAPPSRRKLPEFGLGSGEFTEEYRYGIKVPRVVSAGFASLEEDRVATLDAITFHRLRFPLEHLLGWYFEVIESSGFWNHVDHLVCRGIFEEHELKWIDSTYALIREHETGHSEPEVTKEVEDYDEED